MESIVRIEELLHNDGKQLACRSILRAGLSLGPATRFHASSNHRLSLLRASSYTDKLMEQPIRSSTIFKLPSSATLASNRDLNTKQQSDCASADCEYLILRHDIDFLGVRIADGYYSRTPMSRSFLDSSIIPISKLSTMFRADCLEWSMGLTQRIRYTATIG